MAVAAEEQHRRLAVRCCQLKPAGGGLVGDFYLSDDAGERPVAKAIFGKRQNFGILATLRIENLVGAEPNLLQARRIKVEPRHGPEDGEARFCGKTRGDPGGEQGGAGIIIEAGRRGRDLMQARAVKAMIGQALVNRGQPEGQRRPAFCASIRQLCTKHGKLIDPVLVEGRGTNGHGNNDSNVPYMFI